jgi:hypothetical protein
MEEDATVESSLLLNPRHSVPEGRKSWGEVPGRDYMRGQAAADQVERRSQGIPKYVHGQLLVRDIATDVELPLPLPLCRVLLLDSTSPVITKWEKDRGDSNFSKTQWTFPPATPRELERHESEHQLIASGSMMGAHRTTNFDRPRNGTLVRLSETQIIDADDSEKLAFTVSERNPRRGFSIKVRILLRASKENSCVATVLGEVRPVGKNMSNQAAVHKAFLLVLNEITARYGTEGNGLMAGFLQVVNSLPNSDIRNGKSPTTRSPNSKDVSFSPFPRTEPRAGTGTRPNRSEPSAAAHSGTNTSSGHYQSGLVSLDDMMKREKMGRPSTPATAGPLAERQRNVGSVKKEYDKKDSSDFPADETQNNNNPVTIEVKPLPKIRLSLMPAPREEDEEESSADNRVTAVKKKKSSSRRRSEEKKTSSRTSPR